MSGRTLEFFIPGDLRAPTGGYGYDRRMIAELRDLGWRVTVHTLHPSFPLPSAAALDDARSQLARLPAGALVLVDGLALGAMPQVLLPHASRLRLVALVHHPLCAEGGLTADVAASLTRSETLALTAVRHVVVTSRATRHALDALAVDPASVSVVEPGTDPAPLTRRSSGARLQMLCVATVIPRKGHDLLIGALAALRSTQWHLTCVGSLERDPATVARLRGQLQQQGLWGQVTLTGEVGPAELAQHFERSDLFVLATRMEGYGMAVAEALAHGLPVISTRTGAIPELVGAGAGLVVPPDEESMLRNALGRVLREPDLVVRLANAAAVVRESLPGWRQAGACLSDVLGHQ